MPKNTAGRVALTHPSFPGEILYVRPPGVAARVKRGWIAPDGWKPPRSPKPPPATAVDETPHPPEGDEPNTPSKEES